ncbi:MAG: ABC transporter ATP-binding protein/permease [Clostridiales bacterium]|nr:ABC transporter ATP-binding protein/permease [Clostridiales bacterium]
MSWIEMHEDTKVPVFKNIFYAAKILYKSHKPFIFWQIISQTSYLIFKSFIQSVLFLRILLSVIEGNKSFEYYIKTLLVFFAIGIINEIISVLSDYKSLVGQKKIYKSLNNIIFEKAAAVDISCYEDPAFYDKYQRASEIITNGYFYAFAYHFSNLIGSFISFFSVIGIVASIDPAYLIFLCPVIFVFAVEVVKSRVVYKRDFKMTQNNRVKAYAQRTLFLKDFSKDIHTSNIFAVIKGRFDKAVSRNIEILKKYGAKLFAFSMLSSFLGEFIPVAGTYAFAAYQFIFTKTLKVSGFSVVLSSINSVREAAFGIADSFSELSASALYFQNLHEFFDYESKVISGNKKAEDFESIEFKNVYFKYPAAKNYSLKNVNIKINKGETAAVVGVNGAGKTTFVKLLLRFYDVSGGEILYNGTNIKEYELESLRSNFATVFQDYKNFALSVYENIMCRECTEKDKIIANDALKKSGALEKINSLPNGADTVLTREFDEKGAGLSGGEAQKTAVARMFAKDFSVAILDEPSSALDPIAEYNMYENLIQATKNKTVIYISHRLSSAVLSDIIFVLENGTVIESGNHKELTETGGKYAKMFAMQASGYNKEDLNSEAK